MEENARWRSAVDPPKYDAELRSEVLGKTFAPKVNFCARLGAISQQNLSSFGSLTISEMSYIIRALRMTTFCTMSRLRTTVSPATSLRAGLWSGPLLPV